MSEGMTHTPGPWLYRPNKFDDWGFVRAQAQGSESLGNLVAVAKDSSVTWEDHDTHRSNRTDPYEANARLIAAAPDMLEGLKGIRSNLIRLAWEENSLMIEGIDKLIAKAEGRS